MQAKNIFFWQVAGQVLLRFAQFQGNLPGPD
jgi:hypothetical protein